ncbi:hypothetical protein ACFXOM_21035 [Streptomyces sp. NPDC059169]|uniref:hypothetical protein n=1 Tax=Streptomyces sp. NPDC059169 TaxID=3346754 RepID=UPI0036A649D9
MELPATGLVGHRGGARVPPARPVPVRPFPPVVQVQDVYASGTPWNGDESSSSRGERDVVVDVLSRWIPAAGGARRRPGGVGHRGVLFPAAGPRRLAVAPARLGRARALGCSARRFPVVRGVDSPGGSCPARAAGALGLLP